MNPAHILFHKIHLILSSIYAWIFQVISSLQVSLTAFCKVVLEKVVVTQLFKKFTIFYGTLWFITVFTRTLHWTVT